MQSAKLSFDHELKTEWQFKTTKFSDLNCRFELLVLSFELFTYIQRV
jgi:hypothetical protein